MVEAKQMIRAFIIEEFEVNKDKLSDSKPLFDSGIIDSLGMVKLTAFIESTFKIAISPSEVTMDNFDTVDKIAGYVDKKLKKDK